MKTTKIKTIDINCKEWFDSLNGNSYFAGTIIINLQMKNSVTLNIPFQYGYGDIYRYKAFDIIKKELSCFRSSDTIDVYWRAYKKYNIITRHTLQKNCKKRELTNI